MNHDVQRRWVVLKEHGDHIPLVISECGVLEPLSGSGWASGARVQVMQPDYTGMIFGAIAPPAMQGRRYLSWASASPPGSELPLEAPWTAHPQGFLLIRGSGPREFVYWNGDRYSLSEIRTALKAGPMPLDAIVDPLVRLRVARDRMAREQIGDPVRFVAGLLSVVRNPEAEAARATPVRSADPDADFFGMEASGSEPHALWFESVGLLREFGEQPDRRNRVVDGLKPLVGVGPEHRRLVLALTLSQLGSDSGRDVLVRALNRESSEGVSAQPGGGMSFPGRFPFDSSVPAAAAHALGRLGDRRGLKHPDPHVRLAGADALVDKPDEELRHVLAEIAASAEGEVARLRHHQRLDFSA